MKETPKILFISQEITPYVAENKRSLLCRMLPQYAQESGFETRTFMPKYGEINERRNQLHEVIRLSGMNLIIDDTDHPLIIKVASIPSARIQVYFIDNEDFFHRRRSDEEEARQADNHERLVFYVRGVLETVKKLRWTPDVIFCQGWMSTLAPIYLKKTYIDDPFFSHSKIIFSLTDQPRPYLLSESLATTMLTEGVTPDDVKAIQGKPVEVEDLCQLAIDHSDAIAISSPDVNPQLLQYAAAKGLPTLNCPPEGEEKTAYINFFRSLIG